MAGREHELDLGIDIVDPPTTSEGGFDFSLVDSSTMREAVNTIEALALSAQQGIHDKPPTQIVGITKPDYWTKGHDHGYTIISASFNMTDAPYRVETWRTEPRTTGRHDVQPHDPHGVLRVTLVDPNPENSRTVDLRFDGNFTVNPELNEEKGSYARQGPARLDSRIEPLTAKDGASIAGPALLKTLIMRGRDRVPVPVKVPAGSSGRRTG